MQFMLTPTDSELMYQESSARGSEELEVQLRLTESPNE